MTGRVIETDGLVRVFRQRRRPDFRAVDGISLRVDAGEAVGYIGPNGAGKSTTIKMLTGILVPTAGTVRVCGLDPVRQRRALSRRLGVVFGQRSQLWWDLPLRASFELLRAIHQVPPAAYRERLAHHVELLDLAPLLDLPVRQLSLGQRMRGEVTAALLHAPELLVLDEPTIGLDLVSKERLRRFLADLNAAGTTLLLTTHDLPDVERLCRRLVVVDHGHVLVDGPLDELRRRFSGTRELVVELGAPAPADRLAGLAGVDSVRVEAGGLRQRLTFRSDSTSATALIAAVAERVTVRDLAVAEPAIEDVVRQLYGEHG
ncbi:MAG TPA: ATP-binding cassette domain-containing protein [Pseudonocardiaceae bacterium]|nr:ATP-binding cassette domain-containing protein [Pseudonocardiaceae bacterium]